MNLPKTLQYVGYAGTALLAVLCFINGQYVFAIIMCLVLGMFLLDSFLSRQTNFDSDLSGEIPDPATIKQYRIDHPGTSIPEAVNAIMKNRNDGTQV